MPGRMPKNPPTKHAGASRVSGPPENGANQRHDLNTASFWIMEGIIRHHPVNTPEIGYIFTRKCHSLLPGERADVGWRGRMGEGQPSLGGSALFFWKKCFKKFRPLSSLPPPPPPPPPHPPLRYGGSAVSARHNWTHTHTDIQRARNSKLAKFEAVPLPSVDSAFGNSEIVGILSFSVLFLWSLSGKEILGDSWRVSEVFGRVPLLKTVTDHLGFFQHSFGGHGWSCGLCVIIPDDSSPPLLILSRLPRTGRDSEGHGGALRGSDRFQGILCHLWRLLCHCRCRRYQMQMQIKLETDSKQILFRLVWDFLSCPDYCQMFGILQIILSPNNYPQLNSIRSNRIRLD